MRGTRFVRSADVQRLLNMVIDVCQGSVDPVQRKQALVGGLCEMFRARVGEMVEIEEGADHTPAAPRRFASLVDHGWDNAAQRAAYVRSVERIGPNGPMSQRVLAQPGAAFTHRREDVVEDKVWYESAVVNEIRKPAGIDHLLGLYRRFPMSPRRGDAAAARRKPAVLGVGIGLHRPTGDKAFTRGDVQLLSHVTEALARLYPAALADADEPVWRSLPPRLRQALNLLLQGLSDKAIAGRMGISRHTVHDYSIELYRRFEVEGRTSLMARTLRKSVPSD